MRQFYIPPGFAHGFAVISETALFHYKCTEPYAPQNELGFRWDDPDVGIKWPVAAPTLSKRDAWRRCSENCPGRGCSDPALDPRHSVSILHHASPQDPLVRQDRGRSVGSSAGRLRP